jgi:hypothetical protein
LLLRLVLVALAVPALWVEADTLVIQQRLVHACVRAVARVLAAAALLLHEGLQHGTHLRQGNPGQCKGGWVA